MTGMWAVSAPSTAPGPLLYVFAALAAGGLLTLLWNAYQQIVRGGQAQNAKEIAQAAQEQSARASELWTAYRVELDDAKAQLAEYLEQLVQVNRDLGAAVSRISQLEEALRRSHGENQKLLEQLVELRKRREELLSELKGLRERIKCLECHESRSE